MNELGRRSSFNVPLVFVKFPLFYIHRLHRVFNQLSFVCGEICLKYRLLHVSAIHEKGFIGFVIFSEIYMILTVLLLHWKRAINIFSKDVCICLCSIYV